LRSRREWHLSKTPIILASASPRRRELLSSIGLDYIIDPADIDETEAVSRDPVERVIKLAEKKAVHVACKYPSGLVIGADTIVLINGKVLNKPKDTEDVFAMLSMLSGKVHEVVTGVAVVRAPDLIKQTGWECTKVTFKSITPEEIRRYIATKEPLDKAGAYGIQGIGALFVTRIEGCYPNVVGLPIPTLARLLKAFGVYLP
jgi:septum formation protein